MALRCSEIYHKALIPGTFLDKFMKSSQLLLEDQLLQTCNAAILGWRLVITARFKKRSASPTC